LGAKEATAYNKRFGEIGGEVTARISVVSFNRRC